MNIEELENKIKELSKELENLKKEKKENKKNKRWRAKAKEEFFSITSYGNIYKSTYYISDDGQDKQYQLGNHFKTKEQAEKKLEKIIIYMQLKDLALRLNNGEKIDWDNDEQNKYFIYYDYGINQIECGIGNIVKELGQIYCIKEGFLVKALEEIGEENLKLLFGVDE